jgi:hypothetical protein
MRPALPNPGWSNCALLRFWDAIERRVGPRAMPKVTKHTATSLRAVEYGHGVYGVVMPTVGAKGAVCKITTDPSEAHTVAVYHRLHPRPQGLVKYGPIFELPSAKRPMWILWREEAFDVGKVFDGEREDDVAALTILNAFFDETSATCRVACSARTPERTLAKIRSSARAYRGHTGYEGGAEPGPLERLSGVFRGKEANAARGVAVAEELAVELESLPKYRLIGRALAELLRQDVLVTDTHAGNFGYVHRGGRRLAVITDPGNVAFLSTRFDKVRAPGLLDGLSREARERAEAASRRAGCAR